MTQASAWQETSWKALCCGGLVDSLFGESVENWGEQTNRLRNAWMMLSIAYLGLSENDLYIIPPICHFNAISRHCRANDDWWMDLWLPYFRQAHNHLPCHQCWLPYLDRTSASSKLPMLQALSISETPGLGMASIAPNHADRNTSPMISNEWYGLPKCPKLEVLWSL